MLEIRLVACTVMLILASILDLKNREISDKVWIVFGGLGLILTSFEFIVNSLNLLQFGIGILVNNTNRLWDFTELVYLGALMQRH